VLRRLPKLEGRDLAFGSYLFTSARHACYDLIERRKRTEPSDEILEGATPVGGGVGGGGLGFDPGDPHDDPERNVLLSARQDEIREANAALPERQREVLVLRELEDLSYDEIAEIMAMNRNSVAQLISRARINLRDALRGTALASIAASTADCERALPLLASRQDGQGQRDEGWLDEHLLACDTCGLSCEAMEEAGVSYRAWLPVAAAPVLFRETRRAPPTRSAPTGATWRRARKPPTAACARAGKEPPARAGVPPTAHTPRSGATTSATWR
jgi:RNA polymerase sigma factor (sigma-70 family)